MWPGCKLLHSLSTTRAASNPRLAGSPEAIQVADYREHDSFVFAQLRTLNSVLLS